MSERKDEENVHFSNTIKVTSHKNKDSEKKVQEQVRKSTTKFSTKSPTPPMDQNAVENMQEEILGAAEESMDEFLSATSQLSGISALSGTSGMSYTSANLCEIVEIDEDENNEEKQINKSPEKENEAKPDDESKNT